jgi:hypothetical protein
MRAAARGEPNPFALAAAADDIVVLPADTQWRVPWELLMLGPFASCVLADGNQARHLTAGALMRSASRRSTGPDEILHAADYPPLLVFTPETTLLEAAGLAVEMGWELAVVNDREPRLITTRSVFRSLLTSQGSEPLSAVAVGASKQVRRAPVELRASLDDCLRAARCRRLRMHPDDDLAGYD